MPASRAAARRGNAPRGTGSGSGEVTIRNAVSCGAQQLLRRRACARRSPSRMPLSERKNRDSSPSMSTPVTRAKIENTSAVPRPNSRAVMPPGDEEHLQRAPIEEAEQAPGRVEEVERVARRRRVEHDHVEVVLLVELVELRDRAQLVRARDGRRELAVDGVARGSPRAPARSGARPATTSSKVRLGVEHHRPQLALDREPAAPRASQARSGAAHPRARSSPSAEARRSAGSIVTTATFCAARSRAPARAPPRSSSCRRRPRPA